MSINKLKLGQRVYCIINGKIVTGNITKIMDKGINIDSTYKYIKCKNVFKTKDKAQNELNSRAINRQKNYEKHIAKEHRQQQQLENLFYSYK